MNPKVDWYFEKATQWREEFEKLREILLDTGLNEELKWGHPCYTVGGKNVVLMHGFKDYCALLFHKGVLLPDPEKVLVQQTENVQSARQIRFKNLREIFDLETVVRDYVREAIEVEKAGLKVQFKETKGFEMPDEFERKIASMPKLKKAFESLTQGRQKGYLLYFAGAKQSKTRDSRIEKYIPQILAGKGIDD